MEPKQKLTPKQILIKLNELYDKEEELIKESDKLKKEYQQLQEDKEFLQTMYMYVCNRIHNNKRWEKRL